MVELETRQLYDLEETIAKELFLQVRYPWEVLPRIEAFILALGETLSEDDYEKVGNHIWIARSAVVAPTAYLKGPVIVDQDAEIRHCAYVRGNAIIGERAVVGNSTEVKNSILFNDVQIPHYNYVGDSILGYQAHFGAGAITSNVRADRSLAKIRTEEEVFFTGLRKCGAMVGDRVEVGCNSVLNPGTVIGREAQIYPMSMVRGYVPKEHIYKTENDVVKKEG